MSLACIAQSDKERGVSLLTGELRLLCIHHLGTAL
jgi:hypothetical protein